VAEELFLGLDIGTSGVKAILMAQSGSVDAAATSPLTMDTPRPGWAEQDPEAWWSASRAAIRDVLAQRAAARIAAVGISGQMHSSVFLDRRGSVIRPALLWCDGRTTAECREIEALARGEARLREWVCNPALEGFTLPKVLWLKHHEPAAFARLATVLLATGGGAKNPFLRQLQADVFGLPVTTVNREEGPAYGAALLAAVGAGAFPDLPTAAQRTLTRAPPTSPDPAAHRDYQRIYQRFRSAYPAAGSPVS
jgi:sugar (pentulose or hexulose) kinase